MHFSMITDKITTHRVITGDWWLYSTM